VRFCVYQGITTLINSAYKNRGHVQVVASNLKQRRMYNLTMSCGGVLLDILRHFLNYEKIIIARMHARGNDDVDNKTSDEMTRKMGNRTNRATTHT
jgi:NADH:ubiquinone oxidoreductase subunit D